MVDQPSAKPQESIAPAQPNAVPVSGGEFLPAPTSEAETFDAKDAAAVIPNPVDANAESIARTDRVREATDAGDRVAARGVSPLRVEVVVAGRELPHHAWRKVVSHREIRSVDEDVVARNLGLRYLILIGAFTNQVPSRGRLGDAEGVRPGEQCPVRSIAARFRQMESA